MFVFLYFIPQCATAKAKKKGSELGVHHENFRLFQTEEKALHEMKSELLWLLQLLVQYEQYIIYYLHNDAKITV